MPAQSDLTLHILLATRASSLQQESVSMRNLILAASAALVLPAVASAQQPADPSMAAPPAATQPMADPAMSAPAPAETMTSPSADATAPMAVDQSATASDPAATSTDPATTSDNSRAKKKKKGSDPR